jgi:hypothetical protein
MVKGEGLDDGNRVASKESELAETAHVDVIVLSIVPYRTGTTNAKTYRYSRRMDNSLSYCKPQPFIRPTSFLVHGLQLEVVWSDLAPCSGSKLAEGSITLQIYESFNIQNCNQPWLDACVPPEECVEAGIADRRVTVPSPSARRVGAAGCGCDCDSPSCP